MRPIDKATARYHTDLSDERYHSDGRSKRLTKRFAKRKSSKAYRRAVALQTNASFWRMIEHRRKEPVISLEEMRRLIKAKRCQVHKLRNILAKLPRAIQA